MTDGAAASSNPTELTVRARYFPATGQAVAQAATLSPGIGRGVVLLSVAGEMSARRVSVNDLTSSERFAHATRTIVLPDGGVLEIDDGAALSRLLTAAGKPDAVVTRWQHSWRAVIASLLLSIVAVVAGYIWVLPFVADRLAARVPASWAQALDGVVLDQLKRQDSLQPSELSESRQAALRERFNEVVRSAPPADANTQVQVHFYKMGKVPNAFALPGGSIVFLDGLVELAPDNDALVGVFAHEYGHVRYRHGLRTLLRTAAVSAVAAWYFGDFTSLSNAAIIVSQLSYSRDFETQADDVAIRLMREGKLNTKSLAELFRRMRDRAAPGASADEKPSSTDKDTSGTNDVGKRSRDRLESLSIPEFLSTHPDIERRIERFEKASAGSN